MKAQDVFLSSCLYHSQAGQCLKKKIKWKKYIPVFFLMHLVQEEDDKEGGDEPICDIDEILKRAETR